MKTEANLPFQFEMRIEEFAERFKMEMARDIIAAFNEGYALGQKRAEQISGGEDGKC